MSDSQNARATEHFLKSNGPADGEFDPPPDFLSLLDGKSKLERESYISQYRQEQQNKWLIRNVVGLKRDLRLHQDVMDGVVQDLAPWKHIRDKWLNGKKNVAKILLGLLTLSLLPAVGVLGSDLIKPWLFHLFGIPLHP